MQQSLSPSNEPGAAALGGLKSYALRWEFCLAVLAEAAAALRRTREQRLLFFNVSEHSLLIPTVLGLKNTVKMQMQELTEIQLSM